MTGLDNAYSLYTHCRPICVCGHWPYMGLFLMLLCCGSGHWLSRWCRRINALFHLQAFIVTVTSVSWGRIVWKNQHTLHFRQMSVFQELKRYFVWEQEDKSRAKNQFLPSSEFCYAWDWSNELWILFSLSADGDRAWKDGLTYKRLSMLSPLGFQEFSSRGQMSLFCICWHDQLFTKIAFEHKFHI